MYDCDFLIFELSENLSSRATFAVRINKSVESNYKMKRYEGIKRTNLEGKKELAISKKMQWQECNLLNHIMAEANRLEFDILNDVMYSVYWHYY